ncbi:unnamed protein product [Cochlearia groenlandica]
MPARPDQRGVEKLVRVSDAPDPSVDYMLSLIRAKHKFTHQSCRGGVRAADIVKPRKVEEVISNQIDLQKLIANVGDACYERVKALNEEMAVKMHDMLDLAVTSIETYVLLKFSQMERMIGGIFDTIRRTDPTTNEPRPFSESTNSGTNPPDDAKKPDSEGFNQTGNENVESPNRVVRNVLADLNAVADKVLGGGDETYGEEEVHTNSFENTKTDVEDKNVLVDLNDAADEVSGGGNEIRNDDQFPSKSYENKKMDAGVSSEEINERSASKTMIDEQEDIEANDSHPQPLESFTRGDDLCTVGIVPYEDPEDQVILLGYKNQDDVSVTDEEIQQAMGVGIGGKDDDVGETSGTVNNEGNVDEPPSFSLGLTQELKKRKMFSQCYTRRKKRTKYASSSLNDFVVDLPGKGIHCLVSDLFKPPLKDEVDMITKLMEKPSYFPTYHGHTLTEANFIELLVPATVTSTLMMDTLVSYLHDDVLLQSKSKHPLKYDILDNTFVHDIGLLHALIQPGKRQLSEIASLMLMLLHVHKKLDDNIELTRTQVVGATKHYDVDLFHTVMKALPH